MFSLGCESCEALTSPQPQTREKRYSVELRLLDAQMFRTRKYWYPPCKGSGHAQISDPKVQVSLTFFTHQAVQTAQGRARPVRKTYVSPTQQSYYICCYHFGGDPTILLVLTIRGSPHLTKIQESRRTRPSLSSPGNLSIKG
jgi:hypothetical protein